jgi:hypothetical protein
MPAYYRNGAIHMFQIGEEEPGNYPDDIIYPINI